MLDFRTVFEDFQPLAAIATTPSGAKTLQPFCQISGASLWIPQSLTGVKGNPYPDPLKTHIANLWQTHRAFVFCLATGAVVRLIAPLLQHKSSDPAVVVVDEASKFVISLCSGHQGGADKLARLIAESIGATPVLTGASSVSGLPAVDLLGVPFGWHKGEGDWTGVSAAIARGETVEVIQSAGSTLWRLTDSFKNAAFSFEESPATKAKIWISPKTYPSHQYGRIAMRPYPSTRGATTGETPRQFAQRGENTQATGFATHSLPLIQWHPRVLWVGIGCERGTSRQLIETAFVQVCQDHQIAACAIAGIATIDLKADEAGILEFCQERNLPLRTFPADILRAVTVPNPNPVVDAEVGTPSVAEAAALCAAKSQELLVTKQIFRSPIESLDSQTPIRLEKFGEEKCRAYFPPVEATSGIQTDTATRGATTGRQVTSGIIPPEIALGKYATHPLNFSQNLKSKIENQKGAVTIAIAQASQEYTGRTGKLLLVGTGPGEINQITTAAACAISSADAVIGYSLYIKLIDSLLQPHQIVEALPITQERQRAQRAIELATWGLTVAVVSSGDCGIYGMAGLVLEELQAGGWDGATPNVQIFPGITALQAAASRVGTPLMHDFCAVSLSDLLTPWEVIEKRLVAAAAADFVTAIYNPKSQTRTQQLTIARDIFLQYRDPNTPVAIIRSAYRLDEQISVTTLDKLLDVPVDMLTTVLIGNQSTRTHANWMITPRGYFGREAER